MAVHVATHRPAQTQRIDIRRRPSPGAQHGGGFDLPSTIHQLHRFVGNRGTSSLLRSHIIQPKLTVSQPDDKHEREADRVADQVMRMPASQSRVTTHQNPATIQRVCTECEDKLQRQPAELGERESDGDAALCEGAEFPPAAVWFSDPMLARIRADQALMAFGSDGEPVALVQQAVVAWGCDEGLGHLLPKFGVDGIFRSETRAAVKTFPGGQGIEDDGIVGPITKGELDRFIPGILPTCPPGTEGAAFVAESEAQPEQTVCQPPGTPPLTLTKACPECTGKDFDPPPPYPPTVPTAEVDDICKAEKCAPAHPHGHKGHICLAEGDQVKVLKRFVAELKQEGGGPKLRDAWLTVEVLDGVHKGKGKDKKVDIRERFVQDCAKPQPPPPTQPPQPPPSTVSITADSRIDPTFCPCGLFISAITWKTTGRNGFIVQEINNDYEARNCDKEPCESNGTENNKVKPTSRFWEAWEVDGSGNVTPKDQDIFTQPRRKPTCGHWRIEGEAHFVSKISKDFQVGNVPEAVGLPSTTKPQTGLGPVLLKREAEGEWNCCGTNRKHEPVGGSGRELNDQECATEFKKLAKSNPELADLLKKLRTPR